MPGGGAEARIVGAKDMMETGGFVFRGTVGGGVGGRGGIWGTGRYCGVG